jgi:diguanylate cyclase (GGDEF)-like protein
MDGERSSRSVAAHSRDKTISGVAKIGEEAASETAKSLGKSLSDWMIERLGGILAASSGLLLAALAYVHQSLLRPLTVPLWQPLLLFGLGGAGLGASASFWLTRRILIKAHSNLVQKIRETDAHAVGELQRQLDSVRHDLDTTRAELREKTRDADTDDITGIPNSRAYQKRLPVEFEKARRSGKPLAVLIIDLDNFKAVNDKSRSLGDSVLREFATELRSRKQGTDEVFRYKPGDEFLVLAPETPATPGGVGFANKLRNLFKEYDYRDVDGTYFNVTFSAGLADARPKTDPDDTPEMLVARAEAALTRAKSKKNTFELYDPAIDAVPGVHH